MDTTTRTTEREAQANPSIETYAKLRAARLRVGLEPLPERKLAVMDPLHLVPLRERVEKLNKVAAKRGYHPLLLIEAHDARYVERLRQDGSACHIRVRDVQLVGDVPDTGAWRYLARLEHAPSGTIIHRAASAEVVSDEALELYRGRGPACDHCDARRKRNDTFVVRNRETGETAQVGRSCLEAYLGADPEGALWAFDSLASVTQMAVEYADLKDAPEALRGAPLAVFVAFLILDRSPRSAWTAAVSTSQWMVVPISAQNEAADLVKRVSDALLPSLLVTRAQTLATDAGLAFGWPEGVAKLPERWHNLAVLVAEAFVPQHLAEVAAQVLEWRDEQERAAVAARVVAESDALITELRTDLARWEGKTADVTGVRVAMLATIRAELRRLEQRTTSLPIAEPAGPYLAPRGTEGRWDGEVTAVRPFRNGGGFTVEIRCGERMAVVFLRGNRAPDRGEQVTIVGTVSEHGRAPTHGRPQTEFARGTRLERA